MKRAPITEAHELEEQRSEAPLFDFTDQEPVAKAAKPRNMAETSIEAYRRIEDKLPEKRLEVLRAIGRFPRGATCEDLVKHLGWPINRVSGRVTELKRAGHIRVVRKVNGFQVYEAVTVNV